MLLKYIFLLLALSICLQFKAIIVKLCIRFSEQNSVFQRLGQKRRFSIRTQVYRPR